MVDWAWALTAPKVRVPPMAQASTVNRIIANLDSMRMKKLCALSLSLRTTLASVFVEGKM
jgi:hypothetical protein